MIGKIIEVINNIINIELAIDITKQPNLAGLHLIFEDGNKKIVAEVESVTRTNIKAKIVGEIDNDRFIPGASFKPSFKSSIRMIKIEELEKILGSQKLSESEISLGVSNVYENYPININVNSFFSNHFAILGNSGSGKSYTVAGLFQRLFNSPHPAVGANIFLFDAYGEYTNAFSSIRMNNSSLNYKVYTTNLADTTNQLIRVPIWLLDIDDLALLLNVDNANQLPIIEKALKLVPVLIGNSPNVVKHKNDIIARAIQDILLSGMDTTKIRDQVTAILSKFNTTELNLESKIVQPGYTRTLKQCLFIDKTGKMQEMELVVNFIGSFIDDSLTLENPKETIYYTLDNLEEAMEFALISEGMLKSDKVYDRANVLLVRLHSINNSSDREYFSYPDYIDTSRFINELLTSASGYKAQIVNFNISYIDDRLAKALTKIISRLLFKQSVSSQNRGGVPFHIVIEEAHRYVQRDTDINILGYNIFERITKEGRKYGIILGLITQRPSELSDTVVSQCSNFIILRMSHPRDLDYIRTMVPNVSSEIVEKIKNLKSGNCVAFGTAFKVPIYAYVFPPSPPPLSMNVDMVKVWHNLGGVSAQEANLTGAIPEVAASQMVNAIPEVSVSDVSKTMMSPTMQAPNTSNDNPNIIEQPVNEANNLMENVASS